MWCAATIVSLCFCGVNSTTVNLTLVITAGYCLIGFADDFLKIYRKENLGLRPYQKIIFQCAISGDSGGVLLRQQAHFAEHSVHAHNGGHKLGHNTACGVCLSLGGQLRKPHRRTGRACWRHIACVSRGVWRNAYRLGFRPRHGKSCNVRRAGAFLLFNTTGPPCLWAIRVRLPSARL